MVVCIDNGVLLGRFPYSPSSSSIYMLPPEEPALLLRCFNSRMGRASRHSPSGCDEVALCMPVTSFSVVILELSSCLPVEAESKNGLSAWTDSCFTLDFWCSSAWQFLVYVFLMCYLWKLVGSSAWIFRLWFPWADMPNGKHGLGMHLALATQDTILYTMKCELCDANLSFNYTLRMQNTTMELNVVLR